MSVPSVSCKLAFLSVSVVVVVVPTKLGRSLVLDQWGDEMHWST